MTEDSLLGHQFDEYRLEALLGQGGMARVYRGLDTRLGRYVAIKIIDSPLRADSEYARRFEREAQAIARLDHPHIVRLYRYGEAQGVLYMAMQYIKGADLGFVLSTYRDDQEFIEPDDARRIIRQVCEALDYAHSHGVIHRDVKPTNIMLDENGQAILTDFGLVLLTEIGTRGEIFGSPHYIAPEQAISSAGAVPQSDLYAVGIILYEMFTGALPYDAANPMDIAMLHMSAEPTSPRAQRPDLSPKLEAVILKAIARDPADRYPNGAALADALDRALRPGPGDQATTQRRMSVPERVAVEIDAHPLPPIPAEVMSGPPDTLRHQVPAPIPAPPPALPTRPKRRTHPSAPILAGALIGLVLLCMAGVLFLAFGLGDDIDSSERAISPVTHDETAVVEQPTATWTPPPSVAFAATLPLTPPTVMPTNTALVLPMPTFTAAMVPTNAPTIAPTPFPTLTPPPTQTPVSATGDPAGYVLLIARNGTESLFIANVTKDYAFPLAPLRLGDGPGAVSGSAWGIESLATGECVAVWREPGSRPPDVTCDQVGAQVTRRPEDGFDMQALDIYYLGRRIDTCREERCFAEILLGAAASNPYELLIATHKEDSLFVVNQSAQPFPLARLRLGDGEGAISGSEWGIDMLAPGACVAAWKDSGKPKTPDVTCGEVGVHLIRAGKARFWKSGFPVYFDGELVDICNPDACAIRIP